MEASNNYKRDVYTSGNFAEVSAKVLRVNAPLNSLSLYTHSGKTLPANLHEEVNGNKNFVSTRSQASFTHRPEELVSFYS